MAPGRLTRAIVMVAAGRAAAALSIFAVNAIAARAWPSTECGLFFAILALGHALVPVFLLGLPTSLLYFFPRRPAQKALVGQTALCLLLAGGLLVLVLYLWGEALFAWLEPGREEAAVLGPYLFSFLPYGFALVAGGFIEAALVAAQRAPWQALLSLGTALGLVGATGAGAVLDLHPPQVLLLFGGVGLARLAAGSWLVRRALGPGQGGWAWQGLGEQLRYTRFIGLNDALGSLSRVADRLVVLHFFAAGIFAHYHLGAVEVPISLLLAAVATALVPEVSRLYAQGRRAEISALWQGTVGRLGMVVLPMSCFLFAFAEPVMALYAPGYGEAVGVFRVFLLALPLRCAVYNPLLVGMGRARWALWGSALDLCLNLGLSLALVQVLLEVRPEWAVLGPAAATVVSTWAQVSFLVGAIGFHLGWGMGRLLPWGRLLRLAALSAGAALAAYWATASLDTAAGQVVCGAGLFGGLVALLLWANPQDRQELGQVLGALVRG